MARVSAPSSSLDPGQWEANVDSARHARNRETGEVISRRQYDQYINPNRPIARYGITVEDLAAINKIKPELSSSANGKWQTATFKIPARLQAKIAQMPDFNPAKKLAAKLPRSAGVQVVGKGKVNYTRNKSGVVTLVTLRDADLAAKDQSWNADKLHNLNNMDSVEEIAVMWREDDDLDRDELDEDESDYDE